MMEETEADLCRRIGDRLAEQGQHERAAAWIKVAALNDLFDQEDEDILPAELGIARG